MTARRRALVLYPPSHPCPYSLRVEPPRAPEIPRAARARTYKYEQYTTESGPKQTAERCFHRVRQQFFPAVERGDPPELKDTCKPREALLARRSPAAGLRCRQCPLKAITAAITTPYGRTASGATRRAPRPTLIHQPSGVWPAALTIAAMPARRGSGRPGQASTLPYRPSASSGGGAVVPSPWFVILGGGRPGADGFNAASAIARLNERPRFVLTTMRGSIGAGSSVSAGTRPRHRSSNSLTAHGSPALACFRSARMTALRSAGETVSRRASRHAATAPA